MTARFRFLASVVLMPLALSVLHADVTLRYKTEMKLNASLPEQMTAAAKKVMENSIPQERVLRFKDGKGYATFQGYDSITDFTTKQITILDPVNKRYAKLQSDQIGDEMLRAMPAMPPEARTSIKSSVTPAKLTGRTAIILGVEAEEHDLVFSIEATTPNMPPAAAMKMVMHFWTAKNAEILRVPAIRELSGYSVWSYATMNPAAGMDKMMKQFPGFADAFMSMNQAMHQAATPLRTQTDIFVPAMAAIMQRMPKENNPSGATFDPDSPYMQMTQEAVEISNAPVPVSVFQVPTGYQETAPAELFKGLFPKVPKPAVH